MTGLQKRQFCQTLRLRALSLSIFSLQIAMASPFAWVLTTPILTSAASSHRRCDGRPRPPKITTTSASLSSSSNWWAPLFDWPSSDPDYINSSSSIYISNADDEKVRREDPNRNWIQSQTEAGRSRSSRFALGCFTEEKAKELRKKTRETSIFHDIMYHSPIASRLASDLSHRSV